MPSRISRILCAFMAGAIGSGMAGAVAADAPGAAAPGPAASSANELEGFAPAAAAAQLQLEMRFDSDLWAAELRSWMQQMSSAPNHVGSAHDKANAEFQLAKFREWGWDASIETFSVLYPTPREVVVELVAPTRFKARLTEPPIEGDGTSAQTKDELPAYNVYGADGDVTAELVYANHGMPDDYKELERQGAHRVDALWRRLARLEAQTGVRTRRRGLLDLFGSARRRLCPG